MQHPPDYLKNPPQTFKVGGKRWRLVLCPLADAVGLTDFQTHTVSVDPNFPPAEMLDTFFHELTHVINHTYGLHGDDHDEASANAAGRGLADFWVSNPGMVRWINWAAKAARNWE